MDELVHNSDAILVGEVSPAEVVGAGPGFLFKEQRPISATKYRAQLAVKKVLKGAAPSQVMIHYSLSPQVVAFRPPSTGMRMVFLRKSGDSFVLTDPYYPDLPAVLPGCTENARVPGENGRVRCEIAAVIEASNAISQKHELLAIDYYLPQGEYLLVALRNGLKNNTDPHLRRILQAELIYQGDTREVQDVTRVLMGADLSLSERQRFLYVIANWLKDSAAASSIRPLLNSADDETRIAAAQALWHMADPGSVVHLAGALDDRNRDVRYYAVRGLAEATQQREYGPSIPEWEENEEKYLAHWRKWRDQHIDAPPPKLMPRR